ncbi:MULTISPECIES: hypothetical protein [unclassified Aureimonas]|uniref:hypothetical protein n=1 Tax=unclassified Aureimonas TaxID=2615206 RepID=UPI000B3118C6|nr:MULTISPECIES: hypothetical protein [unclassified Aureimonas]
MTSAKVAEPRKGRTATTSRTLASGRFIDTIDVPGMGRVKVVKGGTFASAKDAAGVRLRTAIETVKSGN